MVDQALFAGANFLVGVLLARWLEPAAYGAFSTVYAVFLLLGTLHTALWIEPMLVYGSGRLRNRFAAYQRVLIRYHWGFGALSANGFLLLGGGFLIVGQRELGLSFLGLAVAAPLVLFLWLVRRGAYVILEPRLAAFGGGLYLLFYLGGAYGLLRLDLLNEASALALMGLSAFFAGVWVRFSFRRHLAGSDEPVDPAEVRSLHWSYGRWALLASILSWVPMNLYFVVLPTSHGLEAVASLKALMNLVLPILQLNAALAGLLLPAMVRWRRERHQLVRKAISASFAFFLLASLYLCFLMSFGDEVVRLMYAGRYVFPKNLLLYVGVMPYAFALISSFGSLLRALEKPNVVAVAWGTSAALAVALMPFVTNVDDGVRGSVLATLVVFIWGASLMVLLSLSFWGSFKSEVGMR